MKTFFIFALFSICSIAQAQYTVIHVIGKIYNTSTNSYLTSGSKLEEASELKFETPEAKAAVLSTTRGRYIIQKSNLESTKNDLVYALSSVLSPARGKLSTRAGGINNQMDFVKKFGEGTTAWLGNSYKVKISPTAYPTDETHFFYVSYTYNDEIINKRLISNKDTLTFELSTFYAVDELPIDPNKSTNLLLYYYNSTKKESSKLTSLSFAIVEKNEFIEIVDSFRDLELKERIEAIHEIIINMYGQCSEDEIIAAIEMAD